MKENDDRSLAPVGVADLKDKADINNGTKLYLPEPLFAALEIADFQFDSSDYGALVGKRFQIIFAHPRPDAVPFVAQRGGEGIRTGAIYLRREGQTEEANYEEVQRLLDQRLELSPQTREARGLKEHLEELRVLYGEIPRQVQSFGIHETVANWTRLSEMLIGKRVENSSYPKEDYQSFVLRMLEGKKRLIAEAIGVK